MSTKKIIETDSELITKIGSKITVNGRHFYYIPLWYEEIGNGHFIEHKFEDLPQEVIKKIIYG